MVSQSNINLFRLSHQLYNYREPALVCYMPACQFPLLLFREEKYNLNILFTASYYFFSNKAQNKSVFHKR